MRLGTTTLSVTRPGSKRRRRAVGPPPTYTLTSNPSVDEGDSMTVTVTTTNVANNTVLYWSTSNITTSDPDFTATSGTTTITNNSGSFSVAAVADSTTEGAETFGITLRTGSQSGPIVASTTNKTINDTSLTPSYSASSSSNINEGSALGVTVTTTNVSDGTTLYWTTNHTTTNAADFSSNSGSFTITSNSGTFNVPVVADSTTEGAETFTVEIRTTSTSGTIVATLPSVTVNDTSTAASYSFSSASEVDEGSALGCTVTTTGVSNGTTLYWTIGHTTTVAADFTSTSGSFTVNSNSGTFSIAIATDTNNENAETFTVQIRTGSTSGTVVETSNAITINNIFFDDAANYSFVRNDSVNVGADGNCFAVAFKSDGTKMYTLSPTRKIKEQSLSTAWDISTHGSVTYTYTTSTGQAANPVSLFFKPDGTKLYISNGGSNSAGVSTYSLSTAWDLSTISHDNTVSFLSYQDRVVEAVFSHDGTKFFAVDTLTDKIFGYNLNTAWDLSGGFSGSPTQSQDLHQTTTMNENLPNGLAFNQDGTKIYISGSYADKVQMYNLSTPYDITTSGGLSGTPDSVLSVSGQDTNPTTLRFSPDGKYMYQSGNGGDDVNQYQR